MSTTTKTGGREATTAVVPGRGLLSIGNPRTPEPEGYQWTALAEVARMESGHTPSRTKPEYWNEGIPWIGIKDATGNDGRIIQETLQSVSQLGVDNSSTRLLPTGTVCLSRTASVGYVVQMGVPMCTSQDFVNWVCGPALNPSYLRYLIRAEAASVRSWATGSTHKTLYFPEAKALHALLPPVRIQDRVTEVLGALDDKISANGRLVSSADALRKATWTRAVHEAQNAPLSLLAQFVNGGAYTKGATGSGRVVVRIAELNNGIGASTVFNDLEVPNRQVARAGDLLMSWSGSLTAVRWYRDDAIINQHIFKVIPRDDRPLWAVACAVETKLDDFREIAAGKATTMGHIKRADLDSPVAWPEISDRLNDAGAALWERALAAEQENLRLAATRDELLPLLMSGKITVKDAEETVEEVV